MYYISELQKDTLLKADKMIDEGKTFIEVEEWFFKNGYELRVPRNPSGTLSKTVVELCKDGQYSFVDIKKKRNGDCEWQTIQIS
jgi:hypothetical protein